MLDIPTRSVMMVDLRIRYSGNSRMRDSSVLSLSEVSDVCVFLCKPT